jgi:hypothetical protein
MYTMRSPNEAKQAEQLKFVQAATTMSDKADVRPRQKSDSAENPTEPIPAACFSSAPLRPPPCNGGLFHKHFSLPL